MSNKIDIITNGYADMVAFTNVEGGLPGDKFMKATGSCCLVRGSGKQKILFDTMGPWERVLLIERLSLLKIHPDDIDFLVCSHSHPDHIGNLNLFTKATKHFVGTSVYSEDVYDLNCFEPTGSYTYKSDRGVDTEVIRYKGYQLGLDLSVEPTQGHTMECISLIVSNCESYGTVGLAGDLFECQQDIADESIWLTAGSQNPDLQRANRAAVLSRVDFILPGHGPLFKTTECITK